MKMIAVILVRKELHSWQQKYVFSVTPFRLMIDIAQYIIDDVHGNDLQL